MKRFLERHAAKIRGTLSCFDRVVITGTLPDIAHAGVDDPQPALRQLEKIAEPVREGERSHRGLNLFHGPDLDLCRAVFRGEFTISGFQARHLRAHLPRVTGPQLSRSLRRLRVHGLIKKIGHRYKYYLTTAGRTVSATALKLRELVVIPALNASAAAVPA